MHVNIIVQLNKLSGVKKYKISIFNLDIGEFELSDPTISSFSSTYGLGAVCHILIYPPPLIPSTNSTTNNNKPNLLPPSIFVDNGFLCCSFTSLYSTNQKLKHFCGKPWKKLWENQDYIPTGWIHDYRLVSPGSWIIYFSTQGRFKNIIMVLFKLNHVELGFEQLGIMGKKNWWVNKLIIMIQNLLRIHRKHINPSLNLLPKVFFFLFLNHDWTYMVIRLSYWPSLCHMYFF